MKLDAEEMIVVRRKILVALKKIGADEAKFKYVAWADRDEDEEIDTDAVDSWLYFRRADRRITLHEVYRMDDLDGEPFWEVFRPLIEIAESYATEMGTDYYINGVIEVVPDRDSVIHRGNWRIEKQDDYNFDL